MATVNVPDWLTQTTGFTYGGSPLWYDLLAAAILGFLTLGLCRQGVLRQQSADLQDHLRELAEEGRILTETADMLAAIGAWTIRLNVHFQHRTRRPRG